MAGKPGKGKGGFGSRLLGAAGRGLLRLAEGRRPTTRAVAYEGAASGRRFAGMVATSAGINAILSGSGDQLRRRSRQLIRNNPWARRAINVRVSNAIGAGIRPLSEADDAALRPAIDALWRDWTEEADADGLTDFYGLQALAAREAGEAGEVFVRFRPRRLEDGLAVPLQLQLIEPEQVPHSLSRRLPDGNEVRMGVEFDRLGRRVAYHMYREHPGDLGRVVLASGGETVRVPASEVVHVCTPLRAGQVRGEPLLSAVILKLHELEQYEDSELVRKKLASMLTGFITENDQAGADDVFRGVAATDADGSTATAAEVVEIETGTFQKLKIGEDIKIAEPADSGAGEEAWMKLVLRAIAVGSSVTYEQLTGDLSGVNFSSIRAGLIEARREIEQWQAQTFVHQFCRGVRRRWTVEAVLAGALDIQPGAYRRNPRAFLRTKWMADGWDWVDPEKQSRADILEIRSGLNSRTRAAAARGIPIDELNRELAAEQAEADALGLVFETDGRRKMSSFGRGSGGPGRESGGTGDAPADDAGGEEGEEPADGEQEEERRRA